jgi:hypothetical protein
MIKDDREFKRYLWEKKTSFVFPGLKVTFDLKAKSPIFRRSLLMIAVVSVGSVPVEKRQVSSANNMTSDSRFSVMS